MFMNGAIQGVKPSKRKVYAIFEIMYTVVDFLAAISFVAGSVFFLYDDMMQIARWLFIFGSIMFALKPTIRVVREIKLAAMGDEDQLAERLTPGQ